MLRSGLLSLLFGCGIAFGGVASATHADETDPGGKPALRIATFNIRYNNPADGANAWPHRKQRVAQVLAARRVDLFGLQEALIQQVNDLKALMPEFAWYGVGRADGQRGGEFSPVFYRADRLELLESTTRWLSETPDQPGSKSWDAAITRIATRCVFRDRKNGQAFVVYNTHFDHRGSKAREESARLLRAWSGEESLPRIVMGDFNCLPGDAPYRVLTQGEAGQLFDTRKICKHPPKGPDSTWSGFRQVAPGRRIDFIFVDGRWQVLEHETSADTYDGRFPSDHLPVFATLQYGRRPAKIGR